MRLSKILAVALACVFVSAAAAQKRSAPDLFKEAQELQNKGQWYDAIDLYLEALQVNPQYGQAMYNLALCHFALESYDLASEYATKAAKYVKNNPDVQNLIGMSLVSLGKVDEARGVFEGLLKDYPNDVNGMFGLAELDLLDGRISVAEGRYLEALKRDDKNKKALLSLALVSAETGKTDVSEGYIMQALTYYSGESEVHYLGSYLAARAGDFVVAEQRSRGALSINGNFDKAYALLASILYAQGKYNEALDVCDFRIGRKRDLTDAWYLKGLAQVKLGDSEAAITAFETGLSLDPQDETMRAALELLVKRDLPLEDVRRDGWAAFHFDKAREAERNFDSVSESYEYQRALSLAPSNATIRRSFAGMLERQGARELYLEQLKFLKETRQLAGGEKRTRDQVQDDDAIEAYESLLRNNLASRWGVDPFYLDKKRWNIGLYYTKRQIQLFHPDLEEISSQMAREIFSSIPSAYVDVQEQAVESYGEAFRLAREDKRDYFVVMAISETERTYSLDATIYSARTGTQTAQIRVYRTGNDRMAKCLQRFRQGVLDILPIRGKVLRNVQDKLLLDLGRNDGVMKGSEFDVVRRGAVFTKDTGPGVTYNKKDFLGTLKITAADEEISEGSYKKSGFYDTLNAGDEIILTKNPKKGEEDAFQDGRPAADSNGESATEEARKAEREALKESLKPSSRENDLIHLIRTIM